MFFVKTVFLFFLISLNAFAAQQDASTTRVSIYSKETATFYVKGRINGGESTEFMVDTGSGYATINTRAFEEINESEKVSFVKTVLGVMADGSSIAMPIYRISSLDIGGNCVIQDIDVAVLPGQTRNILGLSVLKKVAPFSFVMEPPTLMLSNCRVAG
jgi:clan AA aspartic protease (TIGR02281 family)